MRSIRPAARRVLILLAVALAGGARLAASEKTADLHHTVRRGQTLYSIARAYGVPLQRIVQANGIKNPSRIRAGARLVIPDVIHPPLLMAAPSVRKANPAPPLPASLAAGLPWPVEGLVVSPFASPRRDHQHQGLDIRVPEGTPVRAVAGGVVTMAAESYGSYGRLVMLQHDDGVTSYYGHNMKNLVAAGQRVEAGEPVALAGHSGNASCDHLHFEVHVKGLPIDPMSVLVKKGATTTVASQP
jgi:murein DD-endopeptidase MepM/ murein hydrolase activator NlpD